MPVQRIAEGLRRALKMLRSARLAGGVVLIGFCLVAIVMLALDVRDRLAALEKANSDNTQWVMMQAEVEVLRLQVAVEHGLGSTAMSEKIASLDEVRRWFNVLYSRVSMLEESVVYRPLLDSPDYSRDHELLRGFLDSTVPLIDGPDSELLAALPGLAKVLPDIRQGARSMTLNSLSDFAAQSDVQRLSISQTLVRLAVLTGTLVMILAALAIGMSRLYRISEGRAERLLQTGGRLSTIVANSADGIVVTDGDGVIEEFNPAAQAIFGLDRDRAVGRNALATLFAQTGEGAEQEALVEALAHATKSGTGPLRIEVDGQRQDGSTFPAEVSIATTQHGGKALIVAFVRDISERRKAQEQIEAALERAVAGEKAKAEFLAVMSHEMRTPLNGLLGSMVLMGDTALDDGQRNLLEVMRTSGDILLGHVNSVLDISRAEAGVIQIVETGFDADRLVADAVANQAGLAAAGGNRIEIVNLSGPIGFVRGDHGRVRQILLNLIGNAVKFTKDGTITVETERLPGPTGEPDAPEVEFRVIDTGIGISEENLDRIFEDFVTLDASYGRTTNGTGLGLGIARRLAEAMGGEIGAESVEGEGSLFWLRLPLEPDETGLAELASAQAAAEGPAQPDNARKVPAGKPLSILVVEDNEINRFLLHRYLEGAGHRVAEAVDGIEGVARASAERFDVILMDISMPRMDGIEAARRIRAGGASQTSRMLALTAHALPEEQEKFRNAGMEACLTKPIERDELLLALAGTIPAGSAAPVADLPLVDQRSIDDLVGQIGAATAAHLLRRLIEEGDEKVGIAPGLLAKGEATELGRQCHQLAGTCGTFGTRRLRVTLADIETAVARGNTAALETLVASLPDLWRDTRGGLQDAVRNLEKVA